MREGLRRRAGRAGACADSVEDGATMRRDHQAAVKPSNLDSRLTALPQLSLDTTRSGAHMLGDRPMSDWIARYTQSNQNRVNPVCHPIGIPPIALSIPLFAIALFVHAFCPLPLGLFVVGRQLQCIAHSF